MNMKTKAAPKRGRRNHYKAKARRKKRLEAFKQAAIDCVLLGGKMGARMVSNVITAHLFLDGYIAGCDGELYIILKRNINPELLSGIKSFNVDGPFEIGINDLIRAIDAAYNAGISRLDVRLGKDYK
jgi:hypothetical protein